MQEQTPQANEIIQGGDQILAQLREERWRNAELRSHSLLSCRLRDLDRVENPNTHLNNGLIDFFPYQSTLTPAEGIALTGNGIDPKSLLPSRPSEPMDPTPLVRHTTDNIIPVEAGAVIQHGEAALTVGKSTGNSGIEYRIQSGSDEEKKALRVKIKQDAQAGFKALATYEEIHEVVQGLDPSAGGATFRLNLDSDSTGTVAVLDDLGVFRWGGARTYADILSGRSSAREMILEGLEHLATRNGISSDDFVRVETGKGVRQTVFFDKHTNDVTITLQEAPQDYYVETANQGSGVSEAFVDTRFAKEFFGIIADHDLTISQNVREMLVREGQAERFGSVYTQLTREVAKWINRPDRIRLTNIFDQRAAIPDNEFGQGVSSDIETELRERIKAIETDGLSDPNRILIELVKQAVQREDYESGLPVTTDDVRIDSHACFDVMGYYLAAATNGGLKENRYGPPVLEKTHGGHTFMTTEPMLFNGVTLPKGSLLSRSEDDKGWFFQRLTPFTFDNPSDMSVFGSEIVKANDNEGRAIAQLGGIGLKHLMRR